MSRRRILTPEQSEALYQDYCKWLHAKFLWHPKKLSKRYKMSEETLFRYVREHRRKVA